jgi:hypothetical protein
MPTASPPGSPSSAQSALLRLSRRHSLPTSGLLSGFFASPPSNKGHTRSVSAAGAIGGGGSGGGCGGGGGGGNRHRYGHRHTCSEAYSQPIIVKNYNPAPPVMFEEEDLDLEAALPPLSDFEWGGILKAVEPKVNAALDAVTELCGKYQDSVKTEVDNLTETQTLLQARIKDADKLAGRVLKATKSRSDKLEAETAGLKGGAAVDALAEAAEATHTVMTSIVSTLLAIDEMLPPQDRLSPETSAHRHHFPRLHTLLVGKASELNVCFGSGRTTRPATTSSAAEPAKPRELPLRRRLSSSSQILRSGGAGMERGRRNPPPQLQLKTILPSPDCSSPKVVDSAKGAYFPIAPQTATGISLAYSNGKSSSSSSIALPRSGTWGPKPGTPAFFPIEEGEDDMTNLVTTTNATTTTRPQSGWRRSSGSWSAFGGLFGGRGSRGSTEAYTDRAEDRLKKVLESMGEGKGKGTAAVVGSW